MDGVICTPPKGVRFGVTDYIKNVLPIEDTTEFMMWCKKMGITLQYGQVDLTI